MNKIEFNLIDEPWIKVRTPSMTVETVSLKEALLRSHCYVDLAGELPTQDAAVLRLLLAVLHTVFSRADADGKEAPIQKPNQALLRWKELWERKQFPQEPVSEYLDRWHERFWLFHSERPFYQTLSAERGTAYSAAKLNGELAESANKLRLFPARTQQQKDILTYEEAARWLLYVNGFDDTSAKPKAKGLPSVGAGWLGKLGIITAVGQNLFETLMLNLVLMNGKNTVWAENKPIWELDMPREAERAAIPLPDNQAELLTLQSRRILLKRENGCVIGYSLLGGDFFPPEDAFAEQMTLWRRYEDGSRSGFRPMRHNAAKHIWREFSAISGNDAEGRRPGVVSWIAMLKTARCLEYSRMISFRTAAVQYGDKDFFASDVFGDQITFHLDVLTELGVSWQKMIENEVTRSEQLAGAVGKLAGDIEKAAGHVERDKKGNVIPSRSMGIAEKAQETYYHRIDVLFRSWLRKLDPSHEDAERIALRQEWIDTARKTALRLGEELAGDAGDAALVGRFVKEGKEGKNVHYSTPEVIRTFRFQVSKICKEG